MKILTFVHLLLLIPSLANAQTLIGMGMTESNNRGQWAWQLTAERFLATPEWNAEEEIIPLAPDKACQIARKWLQGNQFTGFKVGDIHLLSPESRVGNRYYYKIDCYLESKMLNRMPVYVLLDGTVVEPTLSPVVQKPLKKAK